MSAAPNIEAKSHTSTSPLALRLTSVVPSMLNEISVNVDIFPLKIFFISFVVTSHTYMAPYGFPPSMYFPSGLNVIEVNMQSQNLRYNLHLELFFPVC